MANNSQKKASAGKPVPKKGSSRPVRESDAAGKGEAAEGRKYVLAAFILFFLGLFCFIGWRNDDDAVFIHFFCGTLKGLLGFGYYFLPFTLIICSFLLIYRRSSAAVRSTLFLLLVPVVTGALYHVLRADDLVEKGSKVGELVKTLYETGTEMSGGGAVAGWLGWLLKELFSVYAAVPMLLAALAALLMAAFRVSPGEVAERFSGFLLQQREAWERLGEEDAGEPEFAEDEPFRPRPEEQRRHRHAIRLPAEEEEADAPAPGRAGGRTASDPPPSEQENEAFPVAPLRGTRGRSSENQTAGVRPVSLEEAADIAGVELETPEQVQPVQRPQVRTEAFSSEVERSIRSSSKKGLDTEELIHETAEVARAVERKDASLANDPEYEFPPIGLLQIGPGAAVDGREEVALNRSRLQATLESFGVNARIVDTTRGPTVTRYDLELESGVKLAKLTNLAGDLALSLGVTGVRIAPIPNKISTVGIEVPNQLVSKVYLRDIIDTDAFRNSASRLSFAVGKDIAGNAIVGNIAKLPHLLIAGTTGSGKSVFMNCLILSLLYKSTPEEVRLIMIDPKMVELGIYNGIPHLYIPVVTDAKKAAGSLQWAVVEMLKRYRLFSELGVRDLTGYNAQQSREGLPTLPRVVVVIDELADLMMVASKEVEESICRVAQMGRAAGMHLVIATQRPSADVITGLMKANIPSRVAFAVSSSIDSRIILDQVGAEKLIGYGDMLFAPIGIGKPSRIQGAFVTDEEREEIVSYIKRNGAPEYNQEIMSTMEQAAADRGDKTGGAKAESVDAAPEDGSFDELLPQAVDVIFETKQASVSLLQRRLKLGYSRAARIVDQMEQIGVVGPFEGSKPRQILLTREQWLEMQTVQGTAPTERTGFADYRDAPPEEWQS